MSPRTTSASTPISSVGRLWYSAHRCCFSAWLALNWFLSNHLSWAINHFAWRRFDWILLWYCEPVLCCCFNCYLPVRKVNSCIAALFTQIMCNYSEQMFVVSCLGGGDIAQTHRAGNLYSRSGSDLSVISCLPTDNSAFGSGWVRYDVVVCKRRENVSIFSYVVPSWFSAT